MMSLKAEHHTMIFLFLFHHKQSKIAELDEGQGTNQPVIYPSFILLELANIRNWKKIKTTLTSWNFCFPLALTKAK